MDAIIRLGGISVLTLLSEYARAWVAENVSVEPWQWTTPDTFACEPACAGMIVAAMTDDGFMLDIA